MLKFQIPSIVNNETTFILMKFQMPLITILLELLMISNLLSDFRRKNIKYFQHYKGDHSRNKNRFRSFLGHCHHFSSRGIFLLTASLLAKHFRI